MQDPPTTPCIEFQGYRDPDGYGRLRYQGRPRKANRVYYCLHNGCSLESIQGLVVRHRCDNPACIQGDHLELGTQLDNIKDMMERGRHVAGNPRLLTEDEVRAIRRDYVPGNRWAPSDTSMGKLALKYGISQPSIRNIIIKQTYKDIT